MPVGLLHPSVVGSRILRAIVNNRSAAQNLYAIHLPEIQAAKDVCSRFEINGLPALRIETFPMDAGAHDGDIRPGRRLWWRRSSKNEEHSGLIQIISGARNGE